MWHLHGQHAQCELTNITHAVTTCKNIYKCITLSDSLHGAKCVIRSIISNYASCIVYAMVAFILDSEGELLY